MEDETIKDPMSPHPLDEDAVDEAIDMDAAADGKEDEETMDEEAPKSDAPFGSGTPFGSPTAWIVGATPSVFGERSSQTGAPPSFGFSSQAEQDIVSGSFLNIKPPGTSTAPPVFSFGTASSITLPTPSLPAPAASSPFGAFASSTGATFGSFGSTPGSSMPALPLFASHPLASTGADASHSLVAIDEGGEEMEDEDGDMDAET
jgi:hypothetical protein